MYYKAVITFTVIGHPVLVLYIVQGQNVCETVGMITYSTISLMISLLGYRRGSGITMKDQVSFCIIYIA